MKLRNYILTAGAILALAVPATAGATVAGGGSISHTAKTLRVNSDAGQTAKLKAQIKTLKAQLKKLEATRAALVKGNSSLAFDNTSLNKQVNDLWAKVRELQNIINPPVVVPLDAHLECAYSGNNCTPEELCTIWGYGGCDVPTPAQSETAQTESSSESSDNASGEQSQLSAETAGSDSSSEAAPDPSKYIDTNYQSDDC